MMRQSSALLMLLLAGCASAQTYYYTLEPLSPEQPAIASHVSTPVVVAAVTLPHVLDRPALVMDAGDNQLDVSSLDRWAAPLDEMTAQVLSQDLARLVPADLVIPMNEPTPKGKFNIVSVDVSRFVADYNGTVTLNAYWTISSGNPPAPVVRKTTEITVKTPDDTYNGVAAGMSQAVADLAGQIAASLK